jgi:tRNA(Ile)-lysidine synthase
VRDLVSQAKESIRRLHLIPPGARVLVAASGGVDSMVLLEVLHRLARQHRWTLVVAHLNHQLRGRSSDADERLVRSTTKLLGWQCVTARVNVRRSAEQKDISIEMAARELRHRFLARAARECGARRIALAHHADDEVELFFLRFLRGAGAQGLGGMKWVAPSPADPALKLVRPLLSIPKSELKQFARSQGVAFREDASNWSTDILRNRIRHELLPLLIRRFQPSLTRVIARQMEILRDESEVHEKAASAWCAGKRKTVFDKLPAALQRRVLQLQALQLGAIVDFGLIEKLRQQSETPVVLSHRLALVRSKSGRVRKQPIGSLSFRSGQRRLHLTENPNRGEFNGILWRAKVTRCRGKVPPQRAGTEWFDADCVGEKVILRHWQRGDRFQPSGMPQTVKLQDLFTNLKVPAAERRQRVVATTAAGELWWVEGLRIAETFKIRPETRRVLRWKWCRCPAGARPVSRTDPSRRMQSPRR